ncbi:hypothetical protein CALVIDRAFT_459223, partial [Calocera viscosa TUFC12733]
PKPTQHIVGRNDVINSIVPILSDEEPGRVAILGAGGIGKTTVALAVLDDERVKAKFQDNRVFVNCDGVDTAGAILAEISSALQGHATGTQKELLATLDRLQGSKLLVLDNLESAWLTSEKRAVEGILGQLTSVSDLSLIITMRGAQRPVTITWSQPLLPQLQPLLVSDSKLMYLSISGGKDDESLDRLLEMLGGLPLAIELMANVGQNFSPSEMLAFYNKEKTSLLKLRREATRLESLEVSIEVSLKSPPIVDNPEALEMLGVLALLPKGYPIETLREVVPRLDDLNQAMRTLVQAALASRTGPSVLVVLAPIREYIRLKYP